MCEHNTVVLCGLGHHVMAVVLRSCSRCFGSSVIGTIGLDRRGIEECVPVRANLLLGIHVYIGLRHREITTHALLVCLTPQHGLPSLLCSVEASAYISYWFSDVLVRAHGWR